SYHTIGIAAPILLITLRLTQGLALGGEDRGAATYVAEHAPQNQPGLFTSWIQTTAGCGLLLSLAVLIGTRALVREAASAGCGWRIPFLLSLLRLGVSVGLRLSLSEAPAFQRMHDEGKTSKAPLRATFCEWRHVKLVIFALLGLTAGQATVW